MDISVEPAPINSTNSSRTIPTNASEGERLPMTWCPWAFFETSSIKFFTTSKPTSASRRAFRTSTIASVIFFSVMAPRPERVFATLVN